MREVYVQTVGGGSGVSDKIAGALAQRRALRKVP